MELYFAPLACSMATRMALHEAEAAAEFIEVDTRAKRLRDGTDYRQINPLGQVPMLRTDDGELLQENVVILSYLADRLPPLAVACPAERRHLQRWLSFVATELHKLVFTLLLDPAGNDGARSYARAKAARRFDLLQDHLQAQPFLLDRCSVADFYLTTVLNWARFTGLDLTPWPALPAYWRRMAERPSVARAMQEETALYQQRRAEREAR